MERDELIEKACAAVEAKVKSLPLDAREFWWSDAPLQEIVGVIVDAVLTGNGTEEAGRG